MSVTNNPKKEINSIVLLRAIAALGVCFTHFQIGTGLKVNRLIDYFISFGQQGVTVFFVISGFILPYSLYSKNYQLKNFFSFLAKRSIRVDPPYWCCIILLFVAFHLPVSELTFKNIVLHITYLVPFVKGAHWYNDVFWTLSIEFQFYILLGLSYNFLVKLNSHVSFILLMILSILFIKHTERGIIIANFYQFVFGYIAFMAFTKQIDLKKFILYLVVFTIYLAFAKSMISSLVPAAVALFIILFTYNQHVPVLNFVGKISYSLYLIHIPTSGLLIMAISPWIKQPLLLFLLSIPFSIGCAYLFFEVIEKPSLRLSKRIGFSNNASRKKAVVKAV